MCAPRLVGVRFPAMYFRKKISAGRAYLQIVESRREGAAVRQQVIATLGRNEDLQAGGQRGGCCTRGAFRRQADRARCGLTAARRRRSHPVHPGPALAFERVWEETGCRGVIERLANARKHDFSRECAAFLTVLHRLFLWRLGRRRPLAWLSYRRGGRGLELHHLYRRHRLARRAAEDQQDAATPFARRCVKDVLEEELSACRRDLLTTLDIVFMHTTSLYFEGAGGQTLGRRGFSKDHRPDLNQMILAVLLDGDGRPRLLSRRDRRPRLAHRDRGRARTASASSCAPLNAPACTSRSPPSASPCRRPCARSQTPDPR